MFKQHLLFLQFNKNVECIIDKGGLPVCNTIRTNNVLGRYNINRNVPTYEPYIPRGKSLFYTCTTTACEPYKLDSISQLSNPSLNLKNCFVDATNKYGCENIKYQYYKNIDKLLFLRNNIPSKKFYLADCLIFSNAERVCHRKNDFDSHAKLVYIGTLVKPNEMNILSQDELICEEAALTQSVYCEVNRYIPYYDGLRQKEQLKIASKILLKTGSTLVPLKYKCNGDICGYHGGNVLPSRRFSGVNGYQPPGGSVYRCYYAKKQQVCKQIYGRLRQVYNERDWLSS